MAACLIEARSQKLPPSYPKSRGIAVGGFQDIRGLASPSITIIPVRFPGEPYYFQLNQ